MYSYSLTYDDDDDDDDDGRVQLCSAFCSENTERRQGFLCSWRPTAVRQVQVTETLYERVRRYAKLFLRRLQSVAAQVLSTFQHHSMQLSQVTSAVRSL